MPEAPNLRWDDVRLFLAVARASSLRQAAADLGVSRPTAGRHLDALEERLGVRLFDRRPDGLHSTPEAIELLRPAETAERAMVALERAAQAVNPGLQGPIRVSLPAVAAELLMPDFAEFCREWPQIDLRLLLSYDVANLAEREADVAIRFMPHGKAPHADLAGRLAATGYSASYGDGDNWIGQLGAKEDARWVKDSPFPDLPVRGAIYDGILQRAACLAGMGLAMLPCFVGDGHLRRRSKPEVGFDIWVLVHPDLRQHPRLRVFRDAVVAALRRQSDRLKGKGAPPADGARRRSSSKSRGP